MSWKPLHLVAVPASVGFLDSDAVHARFDRRPFATASIALPGDHPDDHRALLVQLDASRASHVALRSGDWSDPGTWSSQVPTAGARVVIPHHVTVTVNAPIAVAAFDWVRVDGRLQFSSDSDSQLSVTTLFVSASGMLAIGTPEHTVAPGSTVRLLFAPRSADTRRQDPTDMLGGLIALGRMAFYGAPKTGFATPSTPLDAGVSELTFRAPPSGWRVGDALLFPATDPASKDEQRHIAAISGDRSTITLSSPLGFAHVSPPGVLADVPVGNLTRNIILASTDTGALRQRGHVMVMSPEPVHISGAAFSGLGRTSAARPHTLPTMNGDGLSAGENPIGRYAVHFHLVSGASRKNPPHVFTGNVIIDSPKHGLVNHGAYVVAEDNVTFAIQGAHFFAENGSEIGAFRHNLAVFSRGSGEHIEARQAGIADFGHGGHGFWSESPALVMENNYAFHHAGPAYVIFAAPIENAEGTQNVFFRGGELIANVLQDNLDPPLRDSVRARKIPSTMIPFRFSRNVAGYSERGLEIWHTNLIAEHDFQSVVEDSVFWSMRSAGIAITYGVNTVIRNSIIVGSDSLGCSGESCVGSIGITSEGRTRNLNIDNVHIARFSTGVRVPARGSTTISRSYFDNKYNILLYATQQPGRQTRLLNNRFAAHESGGEDYHVLQGDPIFHGDLSMLFERDVLIVEDHRFPQQTIYRPDQHPAAVPFRDSGIPELDGKTAGRIKREYGLAFAGALAPIDAVAIRGIGGLVGSLTSQTAEMADEEQMLIRVADLQTGSRSESDTSNYDEGYGADCCNIHRIVKGRHGDRTGWRFFTEHHGGTVATRLTYVDASPPRFALDPRIKLEIHPDDVKYGFLIQGTLFDEGAAPETVRMTYSQLAVSDGYASVPFEYADRAGNVLRQGYRLKVTTSAVKRGSNLSYYLHGSTFLQTMRAALAGYSAPIVTFVRRHPWTTG